jgi:hypothetical protein
MPNWKFDDGGRTKAGIKALPATAFAALSPSRLEFLTATSTTPSTGKPRPKN